MYNAHTVTKEFEAALCEYTGAKYAVAVNSCTMALLLSCAWVKEVFGTRKICIPRRTYVSVPMSIMHAGFKVGFRDEDWRGTYCLDPFEIWDSARRFTSEMYVPSQIQCVSFHASKILADTQGGAILHDNEEADAWLRRARFDGRTEGIAPKDDIFNAMGWHCYMSADVAARLLWKLSVLPKNNPDLPNDDYPDLSTFEIFKS